MSKEISKEKIYVCMEKKKKRKEKKEGGKARKI
jgi:hypothetical protein